MQELPAQIATTIERAAVNTKQRRGLAVMDPDKLRVVCARGGQTAHVLGRAHRFDTEKASQAGKKGGATVSANRSHMAESGSRGGKAKKGYRERQAARCQAEAEPAPSA